MFAFWGIFCIFPRFRFDKSKFFMFLHWHLKPSPGMLCSAEFPAAVTAHTVEDATGGECFYFFLLCVCVLFCLPRGSTNPNDDERWGLWGWRSNEKSLNIFWCKKPKQDCWGLSSCCFLLVLTSRLYLPVVFWLWFYDGDGHFLTMFFFGTFESDWVVLFSRSIGTSTTILMKFDEKAQWVRRVMARSFSCTRRT